MSGTNMSAVVTACVRGEIALAFHQVRECVTDLRREHRILTMTRHPEIPIADHFCSECTQQ